MDDAAPPGPQTEPMTNSDLHAPYTSAQTQVGPNRIGLTRSRQHRLLGGVIGGLHHHYRIGLDLSLFRALIVIFSVMTVFPGVLAYVLLWALVPDEG